MFKLHQTNKSTLDNFETRIKTLENLLCNTTTKLPTCDLCGGYFQEDKLIKGKKEIRTRQKLTALSYWSDAIHQEEYIHTPKYCVRCYEEGIKGKNLIHVIIKDQ